VSSASRLGCLVVGEYIRDRLPDPATYFEGEGFPLRGPGKWKTTRCEFHDGSDSMRVNTKSGGWVCMACGEKGGDVLSYSMRLHGLDFVQAARLLGAYVDDDKPHRGTAQPTTLSARDAMGVIAFELNVLVVVISGIRRGLIPSDGDWERFLVSAGRIQMLAAEYRT
jgi:CHC2 zinc finger